MSRTPTTHPGRYDLLMELMERAGLGRWRRRLTGAATGTVLDLGAGTGRSLPLLRGASRVVALDPSLAALRVAGGRRPRAHLVVGCAERLPFADGTFDTVVASLVLCSVDDPAAAAGELCRVLAPGGEARLLEHVRPSGAAGRLATALQPVWGLISGGCHLDRRTEETVRAAGMAVRRVRRRGPLRLLVATPLPGPASDIGTTRP